MIKGSEQWVCIILIIITSPFRDVLRVFWILPLIKYFFEHTPLIKYENDNIFLCFGPNPNVIILF